jgi:hypothetical protein
MCQVAGKGWNHYAENQGKRDVVAVRSTEARIQASKFKHLKAVIPGIRHMGSPARSYGHLVRIGKIMSQKFRPRHGRRLLRTSRSRDLDSALRKTCVHAAIEEVR